LRSGTLKLELGLRASNHFYQTKRRVDSEAQVESLNVLREEFMKSAQAAMTPTVSKCTIPGAEHRRCQLVHNFKNSGSSSGRNSMASRMKAVLMMAIFCLIATVAFAEVTGRISGTVHDTAGAVLPGATVTLVNTQTGIAKTIKTDSAGFYSFPSLPIGRYNISVETAGFERYVQQGIVIDVDTARRVDAVLKIGYVEQQVTVTSTEAQVETENAQMGEVIGGKEITNMPLNGRAYTDLLALQPGVVPISVSEYSTEAPANSLNNGLLSMSGAQDVHSGFMVNNANTVEGAGEGTFLIPNLDSIAEFRIITNNAGAEFGGYAGGMVNVVTKSGANKFHGDAFEFFRNSDLNAAGYFTGPPNLKQNIFGGTFGGPIKRDKAFFFVDYQGTRNSSGASTGNILVPSVADKTGDLSDRVANFIQNPHTVNGPYFASVLSSRLGYTVTAGEPYYTANCQNTSQCVFPGAAIPQSAWSDVSANTLKLMPDPNQGQYFNSNSAVTSLTEDKGGFRVDANTRIGTVTGYYHYDPWSNPAPPTFGDSVPGFPNDTIGKAQLYVAGLTTPFGSTAVNTFTASYTRNKNITGLTSGGGVTLSSLGFASPSNGGPVQLSTSQNQNWPAVVLNNFSIGAPISIVSQFNNTYEGQDDFTKIIGNHSLKFGAQYHWDQVDITHPNNGSNGQFIFSGSETGDDFADLLIGAPNKFYQGSPAGLNLRNFYAGAYAEDSWRATNNLTLNYGVRWEVNPFWREEHNLNPVILPGIQSTTFPTAPVGYAFPGEAGIPEHMSEINWHDFAPRLGAAYSPDFSNPFLHKIFGDHGKSSIRAGYGMYYTNTEGYNTFNFASVPYSLFYGSPAAPLFAQPFIDRSSGNVRPQPFPIPPAQDMKNLDWSKFLPLGGRRNPLLHSPTSYEEHVDLSVERALTAKTMLSVSYVGTFGHHLTVNADNNPGDPALCLSVSDPSQVADGITCGPGGENGVYHPITGGTINSTRGPFGPNFQGNGWELNVGNSSYNAFETTLKHTTDRLAVLLSYTFSKALDNGSGRGDQVFLTGDRNFFRGLSDYDLPNNFVASYTYELPFDKIVNWNERITRGWKFSGITRFTNGVPVQISEPDDQSLLGNTRNSPWGGSTDAPMYNPGRLTGDHNPRHGNPYFNVNLFSQEPLGQQGNAPRRFFHGPGINNTDLALLKDAKIKEGITAEFRAEFFNAFNHAQFYGNGAVDGNYNDGGSFGMIYGSSGGRIGQLAFKVMF
jgi:Carboxypeptidase regulatory-like domain